jgi:hypothetical protein
MSNSEIHEHYGWLAFNGGFFHEWRDEVANRLKSLDPFESVRDDIRADLSVKVFNQMLDQKEQLELGE